MTELGEEKEGERGRRETEIYKEVQRKPLGKYLSAFLCVRHCSGAGTQRYNNSKFAC